MVERGRWILVALVAACEARGPQAPEPEPEVSGVGAVAAAAAGPVQSVVVNGDANPVPTRAVGTTAIAGTIAATQSGAWNVAISGTPAVAQAGSWSVGIEGEVALAAGATVAATQSGPWSVNITGTPTVSLAGTPSVSIASTSAAPVIVRDGDGPARHPFQQELVVAAGEGSQFETAYFSIPLGKRLVVEHVTAAIDLHDGQIPNVSLIVNANITGASVPHFLAPTKLGTIRGEDMWRASHPLRLYQDSSAFTGLALSCGRHDLDGTYVGSLECFVSIAGYLIDL